MWGRRESGEEGAEAGKQRVLAVFNSDDESVGFDSWQVAEKGRRVRRRREERIEARLVGGGGDVWKFDEQEDPAVVAKENSTTAYIENSKISRGRREEQVSG